MSGRIVSTLVLLVFASKSTNSLSCKDNSGRDVDWFVAYKIPQAAVIGPLATGKEYFYVTSNTIGQGWTYDEDITLQTSIVGHTISPLREEIIANNIIAFAYNDQMPSPANTFKEINAVYGHAKGIFAAENNQGFWIIHSVPKFNPRNPYPETGLRFGQIFMCISFNRIQDNMFPVVSKICSEIRAQVIFKFPNVDHFTPCQDGIGQPGFYYSEQRTFDGTPLLLAFKTHDSYVDIYAAMKSLISPNDPLLYKHWKYQEEPPTPEYVKAALLHIPLDNDLAYYWGSEGEMPGCDHAKWMISDDNDANTDYVCIGDLNRSNNPGHQTRGGGFYCIYNRELWELFEGIIYAEMTSPASTEEDEECVCEDEESC